MYLRRAGERGHYDHGWLKSWHSFSFADYHDPEHMHFHKLRVINEDIVQGETGFGTHPHRDMEIVTYIIDGELEHKDSLGNSYKLRKGDLQHMRAGTGIRHSEMNVQKEPVHLFQIWIMPGQMGLAPSYKQINLPYDGTTRSETQLTGEGAPFDLNNGVNMFRIVLPKGETLTWSQERPRYIQMVKGQVQNTSFTLSKSDGLGLEVGENLEMTSTENAEFILFEL